MNLTPIDLWIIENISHFWRTVAAGCFAVAGIVFVLLQRNPSAR